MSRGKLRQQVLHLRRWGYLNVFWGDPLWLHHHRSWKEAKADVPCKGEELPVLGRVSQKTGSGTERPRAHVCVALGP